MIPIKKNVALDDLARMVQTGFLDVDKKFDLLQAEMNAHKPISVN